MIQVTAATFIGDPETISRAIVRLGDRMSQFVGVNFALLEKPISTQELAAAIVATPAGQEQIKEAVEAAVEEYMKRSNE